MRSLKNKKNGVSTVVGSMLFLILIVFLSATFFVALYAYNSSSQEAIERNPRRIDTRRVVVM